MNLSPASLPTESVLSFRGRIFRRQELELASEIAKNYAGLAVTEMARTLCELLDWRRQTGRLKDLECRQLLEHLEAQDGLNFPRCAGWGGGGPDISNSRKPVDPKPGW